MTFEPFEVIILARINLCIHPFQLNAVVTPLSRHCVYTEHGRYQASFRELRVVGDELNRVDVLNSQKSCRAKHAKTVCTRLSSLCPHTTAQEGM